jgi:phage-related protein
MVTTGYAIGPAIAVAVGALSSLVSGFVALSASVLSATPSLIVLPSLLAAIGQAALVAKAAFGGIGEALKQMTKTGGGGGGGGEAAEEARRKRIEAAEKNLARVLENNRESLARASRNLTDAEERLTDARKEAAESLQQLNFDAEDAAISEKRAAIQLEKARETLARVQDLPPNSRARREAELAYAEADLNLRRAKDRNADLAKETAEANAKGVEGSEQVVDATRAVEDAAADLAKTERDALRSQVDAEEALADAKKETAKAGGGASATDAYDKLTEAAKKFVDYLISIKPKLQELKDAAAEALLPPLQLAIDNLVQNLFPRLIPIIEETGKALGLAAIDFSNFVTEGRNLDKLDAVAATNVDTISKLGVVTGNLYDIFLSLLAAADPLIRRFTDWLVTLTTGWQETRNAELATGELTDTFNKAGDVAAQLGEIFSNLGGALMNIGRAATGPGSGGQMLLDMLTESTARFDEYTQELLDNGRLEQFFINIAENAGKVSSLFVDIVKFFLKLGENQGIGKTADSLREGFLPALYDILDILQTAAPYLADFLGRLGELLLKFTETGSIQAFFETLSRAVDVLNNVFGNETVQKILLFIAPIMGTVKALTLMSKVGKFFFRAFAGYFVKIGQAIGKVSGLLGNAGMLKNMSLLTKLKFAGWIGAIVTALVLMWQNSEKFREAVKKLYDVLVSKLIEAFNRIKDAIDTVMSKFGGAGGAADGLQKMFGALGDFIATYIMPILTTLIENGINVLISAIEYFIYVVGTIIKVFQGVWEFVQGIFALLKGDMDGVREHFGAAWQAIKDAFSLAFEAILALFRLVWDTMKLIFEPIWDAITAAITWAWDNVFYPVFSATLEVFSQVWNTISNVFTTVWDAIKAAISWAWNNVISPVFNSIGSVFSTVWEGIESTFGRIWDGITSAVEIAQGVFESAFNFIGDLVDDVIGGISATINGIITVVRGVASAITEAFKGAWNFVAGVWNNTIGSLSFTIPKWVPWVGGNSFSMPKLGTFNTTYTDPTIGAAYNEYYRSRIAANGLADGGTVPSTPGGMLALIGEGGRPERVEPLDPDGLSRRDKAMIQMLAGPGAGKDVVINVYPSKGMDEAEVASMVSRQLAFQLRRGAA